MAKCADPGWSFPTFYVIKDSLALLLDGVGLLDDALREFFEVCRMHPFRLEANSMIVEYGASNLHISSINHVDFCGP